MFESYKNRLEKVAAKTSAFAQSHAYLVLAVALLASITGLIAIKNNITINTSTENMLSEKLAWRVAYNEFKENFPMFIDSIVIVVDAKTPDLAEDAARQLAREISLDNEHYHSVMHTLEVDFIRRNQFLYLSIEELQSLADELSQAQPIISQLVKDPSASQLLEILNTAYSTDQTSDSIELDILNIKIAESLDNTKGKKYLPISWLTLLNKHEPKTRIFLIAKPKLDYTEVLAAGPAIESLQKHINKIQSEYDQLVKIRLTGDAALAHDEMLSVINGSMIAGILAFVMVMTCLYLGLQSWVLILSTLITLIIGLILTATFAVFTVDSLNMISVAFAVLYVGLGVDFAIHTCLRYRELLSSKVNTSRYQTLNAAVSYVGASIILCALTTSIGFFAFIPTDFLGVAELGLIAGGGMYISLLTTLTVLPALLQLLPSPVIRIQTNSPTVKDKTISNTTSKRILIVASFLFVMSLFSIRYTSFDIDPINVNDQNADSVKLFKELNNDPDFNPYSVSILASNHDEMQTITNMLMKLPHIKSTININSLIPDNQEEKLLIIDDLALLIGDNFIINNTTPNEGKLLDELHKLQANLNHHSNREDETRLYNAITVYLDHIDSLDSERANKSLTLLDRNIMSSFAGRIERINDALNPTEVNIASLPKDLRDLWVSPQGKFRIEVAPQQDLSIEESLRTFVNDIRKAAGDTATGNSVINIGASDAVQKAFIQALSYALLLITIILWLILRSIKEVIITLFPLLLAASLTCAILVAFDLKFNFANVIALPLLLGIGVDSAIHLVHRHKTDPNLKISILQTSTARSVFFSAATTVVSFGSLANSSHAGTASMGVTLTIGIICVLLCMLFILPSLLKLFVHRVHHETV